MSRMVCVCGAPLKDGVGFCSPCRASLGLPPVPKSIRSRVWTEKERMTFRHRQARAEDLQRRIAALPDPADEGDPFEGLDRPMWHTGAGGLR